LDSTLIIGYGNADRQDDGVAWHILRGVARRLGREIPETPEEGLEPVGELPHLMFVLQLTPELAETVAAYKRVCFVDAHTGNVPEDLRIVPLNGQFQASPFTHHLTPETCLALCETLYGQKPEAILVSVRGYEFGFSHSLSAPTSALAQQATRSILKWLA
jgi:hydrogenase maturation protease